MKKMLLLFVLAALGSDAGSTTVAHAAGTSWKIRIDNWGNPDHPSYWGTGDDLDVYVCTKFLGFPCKLAAIIQGPTGVLGDRDIIIPSRAMSFADLGSIQIATTGGDLFVIDQIELFDETGAKRVTIGSDSMEGFCVSTQASDAGDPACNGSKDICWWEFKKNGSALGHPCS